MTVSVGNVVRVLRLDVAGEPQPQGSIAFKGFARRRSPISGKRRPILTSDNTNLASWRTTVTLAALAEMQGTSPMAAAKVSAEFRFQRLAAHVGARGVKASAPTVKVTKPDLDKLLRAVFDALQDAGVVRDDGAICSLGDVDKVYADRPGVSIVVEELAA